MKAFSPVSSGARKKNLLFFFGTVALLVCMLGNVAFASPHLENHEGVDLHDPESVLRLLVEANARKDLPAMKRFMGQDSQGVGYTLGGRKFVGWQEFAQMMEKEFASVKSLRLPIHSLHVWRRGEVAWFAMELDYIREVSTENGSSTTTIPLRETGVLERQDGYWMLVNWHESLRQPSPSLSFVADALSQEKKTVKPDNHDVVLDLSGEWDIQEEDKTYQALLDTQGNGTYNWKGGAIVTLEVSDLLWKGTWSQIGNDREGGFEVLLSEDYSTAEGVWWYTRVGKQKNIPPKITGGSYRFTRLTPIPSLP